MSIEIRRALPVDAQRIAVISSKDLGYPCDEELVRTRLEELDQDEAVFTAVMDGEVIGFVQAELYKLLYQKTSVNILGLAVDESCRKCGAGRMLVQACEQWAKENGCQKVRLNSAVAREESHRFYEHIGFVNTKQQKRFEKKI